MIYHSVRPYYKGESNQQDVYDITPELFERELSLLQERGYTTISFEDLRAHFENKVQIPEKSIILSFDDGWKNQYLYAFPLLKKYSMRGTFFIFSGAVGSRDAFMNWDEVREMHTAGMEIQSHTRTHPILTQETDLHIQKELGASKRKIETELHTSVTTLAYPFGMFNEHIVAETKHAGYALARTTRDSVWHSSQSMLTIGGTLSTDNIKDFQALLNR
jgi:peptidoglycan/xylan/chitin deacetylase (PgdA/CDA1 family)